MRNPAGTECRYFYGDYYRGRDQEECRLVGSAWEARLCERCPVPSILRANACEFMSLRPQLVRRLTAGFQRQVTVRAFCEKTDRSGFDPHIGCGICHPLPPEFELK
jgi:hypothetical protein